MNQAYASGTLSRHLPSVYQGSPALDELLAVLEMLLLHCEDAGEAPALGDRIAAIPALFTPLAAGPSPEKAETGSAAGLVRETPDEFLPWLASWVGVSRRLVDLLSENAAADSHNTILRKVIAGIVPLYTLRGTAAYLQAMLKLLLPVVEEVGIHDEDLPGLRLSISGLGKNSWLVTHRPFHFRIVIRFAKAGADEANRKRRERRLRHHAIEILELSKPAHTTYDATWVFE